MRRKHFWHGILTALLVITTCSSVGIAAERRPEAEIIRDNYGVPHVYADSLEGLYFGFGYAAAQDRLFQIDMFRRTFWGRLSEVLGENLLPFDQGNRRDNLTLTEVKRQIEGLRPELQTVLTSYAAGINAYIREALAEPAKLPGEYPMHGFHPEPWGAEDVAANFLSVMGFFMDVSAELANASMLHFLMEKHGPEKGRAIFDDWCWEYDPKSQTTVKGEFRLPRGIGVEKKAALNDALLALALPAAAVAEGKLAQEKEAGRFLLDWTGYGHPASYALVVSPAKSATGAALLMGGPQFGFQLPSAVHEVGLHGAGIDVVGSTLAGYPFVMFGHNGKAAFTSTAGIDNIEDIYMEKLNPENPRQYWYKGAWRDMEVRVHTFRIKDQEKPVAKEESYTVHGPVIHVDGERNVAFSKRLSCKDGFLDGITSFYDLMKAESVAQFNEAAQKSNMSINYFFASTGGEIAYYHLGLHPIRPDGYDIRLPTPGTGEYEWQGYLCKTKNPHGANPESGYFANWNNQPAPGWGHGDLATSDVWGGWGRNDRVSSIKQLAEAKEKLDMADLKDIIYNIAFHDKRTMEIKGRLVERVSGSGSLSPSAKQAIELLTEWDNLLRDADRDGFYDHAGAAIYDRLWGKLVEATFGDEFEGYKNVFGQSAVQILSDRYHGYTLLHRALSGDTREDYFNGRMNAVLQDSLEQALNELASENQGKEVKDYRLKTAQDAFHPVSVLGYFLRQPITTTSGSLPPFPKVDRGTENHMVKLDPKGIQGENITAPGTSGFMDRNGKADKHVGDQVKMFVDFTYKPMLHTREAVENATGSTVRVRWE
jgi:penicillin G amidase